MATKDELVAFGQSQGIAVDMSMLKADIEAAIRDAGYELPGEETVVSDEPEATEAEPALSRDASNSTYAEASAPKDAGEVPAPGPQVEQTLGAPVEASE